MDQITFTARPIHKIPIKKLADNGYKDVYANFIEMEQTSEADNKTIQQLQETWDQYISHMLCDNFSTKKPNPNTQFYALTLQDKNFKTPVAKDILGIMEVTYTPEKKESFINFLQTNPEYISETTEFPALTKFIEKLFRIKPTPPKEYSHIGTAMLQSLEKLEPENHMRVEPLNSVIPFYNKFGFKFEKSIFSKYMCKKGTKTQ